MSTTNTSTALARQTLNRLAYGPATGQVDAMVQTGRAAWLAAQLYPPAGDDATVAGLLAAALLTISYTPTGGTPVVDHRGLTALGKGAPALWALVANAEYQEQRRPAKEVQAATVIRAAASSWQLRELMTGFWHNHFNIDGFTTVQCAAMYPLFDATLRAGALGNFRSLLGQVAKSASMMFYLNLAQSTKADPNENFAREVMELHTLGADAYQGRGTPGVVGSLSGFTDNDVTNAARVLTGWTIANGSHKDAGGSVGTLGSFLFCPVMHDTGTKSIMGQSFPSAAQAEGEAFLDLLAYHPLTAGYVSGELTRWLAGDQPTAALYAAAKAAWQANLTNAGQIAETVRAIANHPDFQATVIAKLKDPYRLFLSALRQTGATWQFDDDVLPLVASTGYPFFTWPSPNGWPDVSGYWSTTAGMLQRWNAIGKLMDGTIVKGSLTVLTPVAVRTAAGAVLYWAGVLLGGAISADSLTATKALAADTGVLGSAAILADAARLESGLRRLVGGILRLPEFQVV